MCTGPELQPSSVPTHHPARPAVYIGYTMQPLGPGDAVKLAGGVTVEASPQLHQHQPSMRTPATRWHACPLARLSGTSLLSTRFWLRLKPTCLLRMPAGRPADGAAQPGWPAASLLHHPHRLPAAGGRPAEQGVCWEATMLAGCTIPPETCPRRTTWRRRRPSTCAATPCCLHPRLTATWSLAACSS